MILHLQFYITDNTHFVDLNNIQKNDLYLFITDL